MDDKYLDGIVKYCAAKLQAKYGYCGVTDGPENAVLDASEGEGDYDIKIIINVEKDKGGEQ